MTLDEAISLLKETVKYSCIKDQKHLDLGQVPANRRDACQKAMIIIRQAVIEKQKTEDEIKELLGL